MAVNLGLAKQDLLLTAARQRLLQHMHSIDPSSIASAEMSKAKADGSYAKLLEELLRVAVTRFSPDVLIAEALAQMGYADGG